MGPTGGDARSLAANPTDFFHLYLGTSNSQVYSSTDGGKTWFWLSQVAPRSDLVVTRLVVHPGNPRMVLAAAWSQTDGGGGVFRSTDSGRSWTPFRDLDGQSVRALAVSRKDPAIMVAGTLQGVYQSTNTGRSWLRVSPLNHPELRNV